MKKVLSIVSMAFAAAAIAAPVHADNDHGKGRGHGKGNESRERDRDRDRDRDGDRRGGERYHGARFDDHDRVVVRQYFVQEEQRGFCPPGLAKKHNGCLPPGQAKKWAVGRPLPRDVVYYEVPQPLVVQIGIPPAGYKYVRVASDILMIAVGTGVVADAIQDLGRI